MSTSKILIYLIWTEALLNTKIHNVIPIRSHNTGIHVAIVEQISNHFQNVIFRRIWKLCTQ